MLLSAAMAAPAAAPAWVDEVRKFMRNEDLEVNIKFGHIEKILRENQQAWIAFELPGLFLPHTQNRGGRMVQWNDMHSRGEIMIQTGVKMDLIKGEVAFEIDPENTAQLNRIRSLIEASDGCSHDIEGTPKLEPCFRVR